MLSPTQEQEEIIKTVNSSNKNILISAFAGSGKTTTLLLVAKSCSNRRGLYLAYNRIIREEAKAKFPKNIICKTTHGLAYEVYAKYYAKKLNTNLTAYKIAEYLEVGAISMKEQGVDLYASPISLAACAKRTIDRFCFSVDEEIDMQHLSKYHLQLLKNRYKKIIELEYEEKRASPKTFLEHYASYSLEIAKKLWNCMIDRYNLSIGITHDVYLKLYQLSKPTIHGIDFILIDESQDANPAMLDILKQQLVQRIYVGDQYQQIYRWRGSLNAMKEIDGEKLQLTQSFRFGDAIAKIANEILSKLGDQHFIKPNLRIRSELSCVNEMKPFTVICRTNAGMLRKCLNYAGSKKKIACVGGIKQSLEDFRSGYYLWKEKLKQVKSLKVLLYQTWENLMEEAILTQEPDINGILNFIEEHEESTLKIIEQIESIVIQDESTADIILTTAHKSKGREWSQVKICQDFKPLEYCNPDELNLWYVAVTRAINVLDLGEIKQAIQLDKLTVELVPSTAWFSNVRSFLNEHQWRKIKKAVFLKAGYRCEVCGGCGINWPVECHEQWYYDDKKKIQILKNLTALCPECHEVKHIGLAATKGRGDIALKHLCKINNWDQKQADTYIKREFERWKERSQFQWGQDLSYLKSAFKIEIDHLADHQQVVELSQEMRLNKK